MNYKIDGQEDDLTLHPISGVIANAVDNNLLDLKTIIQAQQSVEEGKTLLGYLIDNRKIDQVVFANFILDHVSLPLIDINKVDLSLIPKDLKIDTELMQSNSFLPLSKRGKVLTVVCSEPLEQEIIQSLKFSVNLNVRMIIAYDKDLRHIINKYISDVFSNEISSLSQELNAEAGIDALGILDEAEKGANSEDDAPVIAFVNKIILDALQKNASDLHFEPYENFFRIRFRIDGILHEISKSSNVLAAQITSRLKIMSNLNIAEKYRPQDGRFKLYVSKGKQIDFRVSCCPTMYGEKIVLRVLSGSIAQVDFLELGYTPYQKELYNNALKQSQGLVLVTGPTGSGKTVSLYTGLNLLNTIDKNISTAEDPVEINVVGINQVQVNPKQGMTFEKALKSFLRQDPDVIMVGEIRDIETADIAIKASQTGHLVLSTLHTNSAAETLLRLKQIGVESYNIATSVILIIAQRLIRKLCKYCCQVDEVSEQALREIGFTNEQINSKKSIYKPLGCSRCAGGYNGRMGIYETLPISHEMRELILDGANSYKISELAEKEGVKTLRKVAIEKSLNRITSIAEILRATS